MLINAIPTEYLDCSIYYGINIFKEKQIIDQQFARFKLSILRLNNLIEMLFHYLNIQKRKKRKKYPN